MTPADLYKKYVLEEINYRTGLYHPVKSNLLQRLFTKMMKPQKLEPNPEDEFSISSVGPNWEIVKNYEDKIRFNLMGGLKIFDEPLYIVRLDKGGYMLLNGHHRWLAALVVKLKKVPVKLTNITQEADVYKAINKSKRDKCVSIDFDEILLATESVLSENVQLFFPLNKIYKEKIRENTALLTKELNRMGYDVWVYTGSYLSYNHIKSLFLLYGCKVDGIVNGLKMKGKSAKLKDIFRNKYKTIVHLNNDYITCVDTKSREYEMIELDADIREWAVSVVNKLKKYEKGITE